MSFESVNAAPAKRSKKLSAAASRGAIARKTNSDSVALHIGLRIGRLLRFARTLHPIGGGMILLHTGIVAGVTANADSEFPRPPRDAAHALAPAPPGSSHWPSSPLRRAGVRLPPRGARPRLHDARFPRVRASSLTFGARPPPSRVSPLAPQAARRWLRATPQP